jgi:hypothetical protein
MIIGHNIWSGGALPVAVTLFGWLIFAKGLALLLVPPEMWTAWLALLQKLHYGYPFYFIPALAIGGYLAVASFANFAVPLRLLVPFEHDRIEPIL